MSTYFLHDYPFGPFKVFSPSHLAALAIIFMINMLLIVWLKRTNHRENERYIRYTLSAILIIQELSLNIWRIYTGHWELGSSLPLHLCGAAVILSAIMLVNKSFKLYEIVYFWGLGGAIQALLTPDIGVYKYIYFDLHYLLIY